MNRGSATAVELSDCGDCGSVHMGQVPCGMTFAERIKTVQLDRASLETAGLKNYYDGDSVRDMFGDDAREQALDDTDGLGPGFTGPDGQMYHTNRKTGEKELVTSKELDQVYLGGRTETDG